MPSHAIHAVAICGLACVLGAALPTPAAAEWRRLDTPNFIVVGDTRASDLGRIAAQFESFRETLSRVLSPRATATAVPTVVIVFPHDRAFTPFKPLYRGKPVDSTGTFHADRDFNFITVVDDGRPGGMRVVFHEYAHLVIANTAMNLPVWLNEGLAEYYSTFEIERGGRDAYIGRPLEIHLRVLATRGLLPIEQLIRVDHASPLYNEGERRSVFYAQSWALTHMLLLGDPPHAAELTAFVQRMTEGAPELDAWQAAFGGIPIQRHLEAYLRRRMFRTVRYRFADKLSSLDAASAPIGNDDVQAMLAALYLRQRRYDDAERLAGKVAKTNPAHAHANVVLAKVEIERGELASAGRRLSAVGTVDDWFVAYSAGVGLAELVGRSNDRVATNSWIAAARHEFDISQRRRETPNVFAHLAMLELSTPDGVPAQAQAHVRRARALAPGRDDYALVEARTLAELGEFDSARRIFDALMRPGLPLHIRETAREWMENVRRMESSWRRGVPRTSTGYRARLPGEERIEGLLVGITCTASAPAEFQVRTAGGVERLYAPDFGAVQFITYRRDITGKMICGPLDEPLPAYVTWKAGGDAATRIVVAIELLPPK